MRRKRYRFGALAALAIAAGLVAGCNSAGAGGGSGGGGGSQDLPDKRVFVSSSELSGDVGATAIDSECQDLADFEGLGGTWKAYISTTSEDAIDRLPTGVEWYLLDGVTKVFASTASVPQALSDIDMDEGGTPNVSDQAMTGTGADGRLESGFNCDDWSDDTINVFLGYTDWTGLSSPDPSDWSSRANGACSFLRRIYCFEM